MTLIQWLFETFNMDLSSNVVNKHITQRGHMSYITSKPGERFALWKLCERCTDMSPKKVVKANLGVCPKCQLHVQLTSDERIEFFMDPGTWHPLNELITPQNPLDFFDSIPFEARIEDHQFLSGLDDAVQTGIGFINGMPVALGIMDFNFLGGSMGSVVGEKITRLIEHATREGLCLVIFCASGGARMQEGSLSLMQMAKISGALYVFQNVAKLLYIAICTSPTTGGVTASFAMLGDVIFAEPEATIAFAGRRVVSETLNEEFPANFQTSEYSFEYGQLDAVVSRLDLKEAICDMIYFFNQTIYKTPYISDLLDDLIYPYQSFDPFSPEADLYGVENFPFIISATDHKGNCIFDEDMYDLDLNEPVYSNNKKLQ
uniref:AccD n=1 Tax=Prototheca moriformis TaxID=183676 RepID=UPI0030032F19